MTTLEIKMSSLRENELSIRINGFCTGMFDSVVRGLVTSTSVSRIVKVTIGKRGAIDIVKPCRRRHAKRRRLTKIISVISSFAQLGRKRLVRLVVVNVERRILPFNLTVMNGA